MRTWDLPIDKSVQLVLAADSRFGGVDHFNDQIWEFNCIAQEPPALTMHTTYGLRARSMRVFPRFTLDEITYVNPFEFYATPRLQHFLPNYFSLVFSPNEGLEITGEFWTPDSHTLAGRYRAQNRGNKVSALRIDIATILSPLDAGESMNAKVIGSAPILTGQTHDLYAACGLSESAQTSQSPYPSLSLDLQIVPGKSRVAQWALTTAGSIEEAVTRLRSFLARPWEAEIARVLMLNDTQTLEIYTGNPEWDFVFAAAQRSAYSLAMGRAENYPAFVANRGIDMGYSFAENGRGLTTQWRKQSALDALYLAGFLLPGSPASVRSILDGFLKRFRAPGSGLENLEQPLLCTLALRYYQASEDGEWLRVNFELLKEFLSRWFDPENDRDQDGFPEWQDVFQSGLEESPTFDRWKPETQGLGVRSVEAPSLASFLYRECSSMRKLAVELGDDAAAGWAQQKMVELKKLIEDCWDEKTACYLYRDYQTHASQKGKLVYQAAGSGSHAVHKSFTRPQRLVLHIVGKDDTRRKFRITLHGKRQKEEILEEIDYFNISWLQGRSYYTSSFAYSRLDQVELEGLLEGDRVDVFCADHQLLDISLLLPLWAEAASHHRASRLIDRTVHKGFWGKYGLPVALPANSDLFLAKPPKVSGVWNDLIGEGLLLNHRHSLAAELVCNWMDAVTRTFKKHFRFQESHHAQTAEPSGEVGHLRGYPPLRLFLEVLGVKYICKDRVVLSGSNPFPWPVTVKYKGTTITRHKTDTVIAFSSGHTLTVSGSDPKEIRLVHENIIE